MSDLTVAKISRCRLRGDAVSKICFLDDDLTGLQDIGLPQITTEQKTELLARVDKARIALDKYTEAVIQCMVLEGKEDYDPDDEYMVELNDLEYDLDELGHEIRFLKPRVEEEKSARARAEASAQTKQDEEPVAKPPLMEKGITLDEMETWSSTWEDYYKVAKLEKEVPAIQRSNFESHLSQVIRDVVGHVLGTGPDSTKY